MPVYEEVRDWYQSVIRQIQQGLSQYDITFIGAVEGPLTDAYTYMDMELFSLVIYDAPELVSHIIDFTGMFSAHIVHAIFDKLVAYGQAHLNDEVKMDYFAVSLPDCLVVEVDLNERNRLHCHRMQGLGDLGLGDSTAAREHFDAVLAVDANHLGATLYRRMI